MSEIVYHAILVGLSPKQASRGLGTLINTSVTLDISEH